MCKTIAIAGEYNIVGFEWDTNIFFLPFQCAHKSKENLKDVVEKITIGVEDYRHRMDNSIPEWVNEFKFENEIKLNSKIDSHLEKVDKLINDLKVWNSYKGILCHIREIWQTKLVFKSSPYWILRGGV